MTLPDLEYIGYRRRHPKAVPPRRASMSAAGWDFATAEGCIIWPGQVKLLNTGLQFFMNPNQFFTLRVRSSVFRRGLIICNSPCDPDYRWGPDDADGWPTPLCWHIAVRNVGWLPRRIRAGDRLAQAIVPIEWSFAEASIFLTGRELKGLDWGENRRGGFGTTGR